MKQLLQHLVEFCLMLKKNIEVTVDCDPNLYIIHDKKWTSEAIFNILDNAVKYTSSNGKIRVATECWVMYTNRYY